MKRTNVGSRIIDATVLGYGRTSLVAVCLALALGLSGCSSGDEQAKGCEDCAGCCKSGQCIAPASQTNLQCGMGGNACAPCGDGQSCSTLTGQCLTGSSGNNNTNTNTTPLAQCNPGCDPLTERCISGACQKINGNNNNNNNNNGTCSNCKAPNQCLNGKCLDKVEHCMNSCKGCCDYYGNCHTRGASGTQRDDMCGNGGIDGETCLSCLSAGVRCNPTAGKCGFNGGGKVTICLHTVHTGCPLIDTYDVEIKMTVGNIDGLTTPSPKGARDEGYECVAGGWGSACFTVSLNDIRRFGIKIDATDKDGWQDDYIGTCLTYLKNWELGTRQRISVDGTRCEGDLHRIWLDISPEL